MTNRKSLVTALALFVTLVVTGQALAEQKTINGKLYDCTKETTTECTFDKNGLMIGCVKKTVETCTEVVEKNTQLSIDPGPNPPPKPPRASGLFRANKGLMFGG